jgi:hypothetical protein
VRIRGEPKIDTADIGERWQPRLDVKLILLVLLIA